MAVITGSVTIKTQFTQQPVITGPDSKSSASIIDHKNAYGNGTGSRNVQQSFAEKNSLVATSKTYDLSALVGALGETVNFAKVRLLLIENLASTTAFTLTVGGGAANPWTAPLGGATTTIIVSPGGVVLLENPVDGWVVDATHKTLKVDAGGSNTVAYNIQIVGE